MSIMWNNKNKICKESGKLIQPPQGGGIASTLADTGLDLLYHQGIPWLGKSIRNGPILYI